MASRMDRYYEEEQIPKKRSERNQTLYRDIYENVSYSNIEGVATIDKGQEIDINKVKQMLKNREEYLNQKTFIKPVEVPTKKIEDEKNYDIREVLNLAKENRNNSDKYKSINNTSYDIFKDLREKRHREMVNGNDDTYLKELVDTIIDTGSLNSMSDKELSLDLLDDLKSSEKTIKDKETITNIINDVKKEEKNELDKSFFTSSLGFKEDDFEELNDIKQNLKTNNTLIKILLVIITIAFLVGAVILLFNLLK